MCKTGTIYTLQSKSVSKVEMNILTRSSQYIWNAGFNYMFGYKENLTIRKELMIPLLFKFWFHHHTWCSPEIMWWLMSVILMTQGLVTIQVNILSMYKHIQGRTSFLTPARFKSCLFFKFLLIYSKPCLVQLPRPYSFQKISRPPLDYLLWRRSGRFCQEFAWVENNMDPKWK